MTRKYVREETLKRLAIQYKGIKDLIYNEIQAMEENAITVWDFMQERDRLLNTPDWDDAPEDADFLTLDSYGDYYWHNKEPELAIDGWCPGSGGEGTYAGSVLAVLKDMGWDKGYIKRPRILNFGEEEF